MNFESGIGLNIIYLYFRSFINGSHRLETLHFCGAFPIPGYVYANKHFWYSRVDFTRNTCLPICSLIARFVGPTWTHLGPVGPRRAPCRPHEPCYLGKLTEELCQLSPTKQSPKTMICHFQLDPEENREFQCHLSAVLSVKSRSFCST